MATNEEKEENSSLNFLSGFLDDVEEAEKPSLTRKATKKEIDFLNNFIGGFEKWCFLNEDCRREVIEKLDYKSRFKLSICSKSDYEIVKKVPLHVHRIEIKDNEKHHYSLGSEEFDNVMIQVQLDSDYNSGNNFELIFSQLGDDTQIQWMNYHQRRRPEKRNIILESCSYYQKAVEFAEEWMKKCKFEIKSISVEMKNYPMETSQIKTFPYCKDVRIGADNLDHFRWWFQKFPEELNDLRLVPLNDDRDNFILPSDFLALPQIINAPNLFFWGKAAFTDDQMMKLKAKSLNFDCTNITDEGINRFLKGWVTGKGVPDFQQLLLWSTQPRNESVITRGLETRPWNEEFINEARGFCDDFDRCCGSGLLCQISSRIDPFESLTLCISDDRVSIYATGKKRTWGGTTYTCYSIP